MPESRLASFFPGYFAFVMATGIVSVAAFRMGVAVIPEALLVINAFAYVILWVLTALRVVRHRARVLSDLTHHGRSSGFFTLVAGSSVLGIQTLTVIDVPAVASALWWLALGLWALITYTFVAALTVKRDKPPLGEGVNGAWLLMVVASQSLAVLGGLLAAHWEAGATRELMLFVCVAFFFVGVFLYIPLITIILLRFTFHSLEPADLTPPYWISTGAAAITTLAGATLLSVSESWELLHVLRPFLIGLTFLFWSIATWWIPLLVILGIWRHLVRRHPIRYDPQYWGLVFPLGMYTVCTLRLADVAALPLLRSVPALFVWIALAAWTIVFAGLVHQLVTRAFKKAE